MDPDFLTGGFVTGDGENLEPLVCLGDIDLQSSFYGVF